MFAFDRLFPEHLQGEGFPNLASKHKDWAQFNIAVNDRPDAPLTDDSRPNRRNRGNLSLSNWPQFGRLSAVTDNTKRQFIIPCLEAAREFMNSCEDLVALATDLDAAHSDAAFDVLLDEMDALAKGELSGAFPLFFGKPVLVALLQRMNLLRSWCRGLRKETPFGRSLP